MKRRTIWGNDFSSISFVKGVLGEEKKGRERDGRIY